MISQFENELRSELRQRLTEDNPYALAELIDSDIDYHLTQIAIRLVDVFWKTRWLDDRQEVDNE